MLNFSQSATGGGAIRNQPAPKKQQQQQQQQQQQRNKKPSAATPPPSSSSSSSDDDNNDNSNNNHSNKASVSNRIAQELRGGGGGGDNVASGNKLSAPARLNTGPYSTFLHSSALLGISQPSAVPPPPSSSSSSSQQQQQMNRNNNNKENDSDDEDDERRRQEQQQNSSKAKQEQEKQKRFQQKQQEEEEEEQEAKRQQQQKNNKHLSNSERQQVSREQMQKQLEAFGISEGAMSGNDASMHNAALQKMDPLAKAQTQADKINFFPPHGGGLMNCSLERVKGGLFDSNVYFRMTSETGARHFLLAARKRGKNATSNYLLSSDPNDLRRESASFMGKVRANADKTVYIIYDAGDRPITEANDAVNVANENNNKNNNNNNKSAEQFDSAREELGYIVYQTNFGGSSGPRKMIVILPKRDEKTGKTLVKCKPKSYQETMYEQWKTDPTNFITLETKEPTWNEALRSYQLNFKGRVTMQSVKNFQLVDVANPGRVVLQVGKRGDEDFVCDFQAPLNAFLALSIGLTSFEGSLSRA